MKPVGRKACAKRLSHSLKRLGRSVGRRDRASIARQVVTDQKLLKKTVPLIGRIMAGEMKSLCSQKTASILRNTDPSILESFSWKQLTEELCKIAPCTTELLTKSLTCFRSRRSMEGPRHTNIDAIVGLCCSLLGRARNQSLNLVQRLISVLLYGGHANKQV